MLICRTYCEHFIQFAIQMTKIKPTNTMINFHFVRKIKKSFEFTSITVDITAQALNSFLLRRVSVAVATTNTVITIIFC